MIAYDFLSPKPLLFETALVSLDATDACDVLLIVFLTLFTTLPSLAFSAVAFILSVMGCCSWYFSMAFSYCFSPFVLCFWLFVAMPLIRFSAVVSWVIFLSSYKSTTLLIFCWIDVGTRPVCLSLKALKKLIFFYFLWSYTYLSIN